MDRSSRGLTHYGYFGELGYLTHDISRERPVHFQWQLLDWPAPREFLEQIGLQLLENSESLFQAESRPTASLIVEKAPAPKIRSRSGVEREIFQKWKLPDYAARDSRNRALGLKGELLVIAHEAERLIKENRPDLAEKIVHVSQVEGDSAGYDIRSFESDGSYRFIEVKTTRAKASTSFFISPNEIAFSAQNSERYFLYRIYEYDDDSNSAKTCLISGNVGAQLSLEPTAFRAKLLEI